ncbi:hypothetical protein D3C75_1017430 [compost metagenome]
MPQRVALPFPGYLLKLLQSFFITSQIVIRSAQAADDPVVPVTRRNLQQSVNNLLMLFVFMPLCQLCGQVSIHSL